MWIVFCFVFQVLVAFDSSVTCSETGGRFSLGKSGFACVMVV